MYGLLINAQCTRVYSTRSRKFKLLVANKVQISNNSQHSNTDFSISFVVLGNKCQTIMHFGLQYLYKVGQILLS